jgi:hypothetical protein
MVAEIRLGRATRPYRKRWQCPRISAGLVDVGLTCGWWRAPHSAIRQLPRGGGWLAAIAIGLQVGGGLGNLMDRLVLGGASDVLYLRLGPTWVRHRVPR